MSVAAIDIGSNSVRLLVLDDDGTVLLRRAEITRLAGGQVHTGVLADDGVARTLAVLDDYSGLVARSSVGRLRVAATAALRRAADPTAFLDAAEQRLGQRPEILDAVTEAELSFAGATADLPRSDRPVLVVDIGGASTELAVGRVASDMGRADIASVSLDFGCVTLTDTDLHADPPRPEELSNAIARAADALADSRRELAGLDEVSMVVGVAGTVTTVAAVELGLAHYDRDAVHGFVLTRAAVEDVFRTLATEPLRHRVHNPGLPTERAGVIVAGCCILVAILRNLPADELRVADADLLDAMAWSLR